MHSHRTFVDLLFCLISATAVSALRASRQRMIVSAPNDASFTAVSLPGNFWGDHLVMVNREWHLWMRTCGSSNLPNPELPPVMTTVLICNIGWFLRSTDLDSSMSSFHTTFLQERQSHWTSGPWKRVCWRLPESWQPSGECHYLTSSWWGSVLSAAVSQKLFYEYSVITT